MQSNQLAVLDDDEVFATTLSRRLSKRGFSTFAFHQASELLASHDRFAYIILDLNLGERSVLVDLEVIRERWPEAKIIILTGYASIATTVQAMKKGADEYLTKPLNFESLLLCLKNQNQEDDIELTALSSAQLEWEHIQRTLQENAGNISATARSLNMHRRTLQRKLQKKPSWN